MSAKVCVPITAEGSKGDAEKSPARSAAVGTTTGSDEIPWTTRRPSYDAKKNVRSFTIGPPNVPPNWFCLSSGRRRSKGPVELNIWLRRYSKTLPCQPLVPDLVTTLITAPELRPYSASKVLEITRNSAMLSGDGWTAGEFTKRSLLSPPLTLK